MAEKAKDEAISKATDGILSGLPPGGMYIYRKIYNYLPVDLSAQFGFPDA